MSGHCADCGNTICLCKEIEQARKNQKKDPRWVAWHAVDDMIREGANKHANKCWRTEPQDNHLDKAVRHIMTAKLIRDGNSPADGENHLRNALCRLAMALTQDLAK